MKEIEYKFVLKPDQKKKVLDFLKQNKAKLVTKGIQDNWYYVAPGKNDLRIRRTDKEAYLILKTGWMHDEDRAEIEVKTDRKDFEQLDKILTALGYKYDTKWHREREEYRYKNFNIDLDYNAGYGWVLEIERLVKEGNEQKAKDDIQKLAKEIGIKPASKALFDKMYRYYKKNWPHYIKTNSTFDIYKLK